MERPRLVPQIYGYAVCLVTIITILIASTRLIDGVFDTVTPEMSREVQFGVGGSFEMYKERRMETILSVRSRPDGPPAVTAELPPDSVLRVRFQEERAYQMAAIRHQGLRRIVGSVLMLLIAGALFVAHWRWLRGLTRAEAA